MPVCPGRDGNKREQSSGNDCTFAAPLFRKRTKEESAGYLGEAVDDTDGADCAGGQLHLRFEKGWIDVLRSVGERNERGHEQDEKQEGGKEGPDGSQVSREGIFLCLQGAFAIGGKP